MNAQVEEVAENRVRLRVEVPSDDVKHAVEHAANDLAASVKIPGFRKGKVPMPVLVQRVGKERLYQEAVESHIGSWFWNAAARTRVRPIEQPQFDYELPSSDKEDWAFTASFAVQPKPEVPDWTELEVPYEEPEIPEDLVEHELNVLRSTVAELAPVEGRAVQEGDTLVVDLVNESGEGHRDYVVELGAGRLVDEIEQGLSGMEAGETREIEFELADETRQTVSATVKEIKEKVLPPLDDELARAASEFDTIDELRGEIESRLREQVQAEVDAAFRAAVVDRLADAAKVDASGPLVETRARELLTGLIRSVERRGIPFDTYLTMSGTSPDQMVERLRAEAKQSVARELVLEAVADQLGIEVTDEQVEALIREQSEPAGQDAAAMTEQLRSSGGFEQLREDIRMRDTLDRLASEVKRIEPELAAARDAIWTPDKETPQAETKLWTPGSKETA